MTARWHAAMRWEDVLFVHWPVDPDAIAPAVPDRLSLDVRDGRTWLSVVALVIADVRPPGLPTGYTFPEVNLRTYVDDGEPSVYFFSIDAAEPVGTRAARLVERASAASPWRARLPYHRGRVGIGRDGNAVAVRSTRASRGDSDATFAAAANSDPDGEFTPAPGSLPAFLMDRHRFYASIGEGSGTGVEPRDDGGTADDGETADDGLDRPLLASGVVAHEPWRLRPASITVFRDGIFGAAGLPSPTADPIAYYCRTMPGVAARVSPSD